MNNEQITNKENGRSMVEMLGVLAVVGVLSIGALAGYVYGMDKYRANEVLNSVSQMAIIGTQQRALNPTVTIDLHEFNNKTVYPFEVVTEGVEEGQFAIRFRNIPEGTCKRLLSASKEFVAAADIDVNGVQIDTADVSCADGDTNAFVYYFDNAMTGDETGGGSGGDPVTPPATCTSPLVQVRGCDGSLTPCCPDTADCTQPTDCSCTNNDDCYGDQVCDSGTCTCPTGYNDIDRDGITGSLGADGTTCCGNGNSWDNGEYAGLNVAACGCPRADYSNQPGSLGPDGTTCCYNGAPWQYYNYYFGVDTVGCGGCPYGGSFGTDGTTCCHNGFAYDFGEEDYYRITPVCGGCPDSGSYGSDGTTCCKNGYAWGIYDQDYSEADISNCGCPDGGSYGSDGTTCCKNGFSWDDGDYDGMNKAACGCPDGGSTGSDGTTCCKNGFSWNDGGYDGISAACGCPDGGSAGSDGTTCCKNGYSWKRKDPWTIGYLHLNVAVCGCPDGGSYGSDGTTCCKDHWAMYEDILGGHDYSTLLDAACGCPPDRIGSDGITCCDEEGYAMFGGPQTGWIPTVCGCPDGGSYGSDGTTCCKNYMGLSLWHGSYYYSEYSAAACGCPTGTTSPDGIHCCKDGEVYDDGYYYPDEACE